MTRIPLGQNVSYSLYLDYTLWLLERNLLEAWHFYPEYKAYVVEFNNAQDAVAFKLKFGV